jgi:hypothetical protein
LSRTTAYEPFAANKATFWFDGCREVWIKDNIWSENFSGKNIRNVSHETERPEIGR